MLPFAQVHWNPGIGDPTFMGWLTVVAYFGSSLLCFTYALRLGRMQLPPRYVWQRILWLGIAVVLLLLVIKDKTLLFHCVSS